MFSTEIPLHYLLPIATVSIIIFSTTCTCIFYFCQTNVSFTTCLSFSVAQVISVPQICTLLSAVLETPYKYFYSQLLTVNKGRFATSEEQGQPVNLLRLYNFAVDFFLLSLKLTIETLVIFCQFSIIRIVKNIVFNLSGM